MRVQHRLRLPRRARGVEAERGLVAARAGGDAARRGAGEERAQVVPAGRRAPERDAVGEPRGVGERLLHLGHLLERGDDRLGAAVAGAVGDVLGPQRGRARDDERAQLQAAHDRRLPRRDARQHHHQRVATPHAQAGERVHAAVARLLHVPEGVALSPPRLVLPVEADAAPVGRPRVDQRAEVELLGHGPPEARHQVRVTAADGDHDATRPRRVDASMYLRDTGERSSGRTIASITTKDSRPAAAASAARSSSTRST